MHGHACLESIAIIHNHTAFTNGCFAMYTAALCADVDVRVDVCPACRFEEEKKSSSPPPGLGGGGLAAMKRRTGSPTTKMSLAHVRCCFPD